MVHALPCSLSSTCIFVVAYVKMFAVPVWGRNTHNLKNRHKTHICQFFQVYLLVHGYKNSWMNPLDHRSVGRLCRCIFCKSHACNGKIKTIKYKRMCPGAEKYSTIYHQCPTFRNFTCTEIGVEIKRYCISTPG